MKLTIESIQKAMTSTYPHKGDEFWLDPKGENAQIVNEATRRGYLRRFSWTQVRWAEEGLAKARRELVAENAAPPEPQIDRSEEARQIAKERYSIVKGLWFEPAAKVQTTSDGKRHVLCWVQVDE
jgi:hypothetical protein